MIVTVVTRALLHIIMVQNLFYNAATVSHKYFPPYRVQERLLEMVLRMGKWIPLIAMGVKDSLPLVVIILRVIQKKLLPMDPRLKKTQLHHQY